MTLALVPTDDCDQAGNAVLAACTASLNSASVDRGTLEMTSCVACTLALVRGCPWARCLHIVFPTFFSIQCLISEAIARIKVDRKHFSSAQVAAPFKVAWAGRTFQNRI